MLSGQEHQVPTPKDKEKSTHKEKRKREGSLLTCGMLVSAIARDWVESYMTIKPKVNGQVEYKKEMVICDNVQSAFRSFACHGGGGMSEIPVWKAFQVEGSVMAVKLDKRKNGIVCLESI